LAWGASTELVTDRQAIIGDAGLDQLFVCCIVKVINQGCSHIFSSPELFGYPVA